MIRRLRADHGYSLIAVMLVMLVTSVLGSVVFAAVGADIPFARESQDRKQAYAAAEAGVEYYLYQLSRDNDYWTRCANVPGPAAGQSSPVTLAGSPRVWRNVTGNEAQYSIELLPAPGSTGCNATAPNTTMLDQVTGTFRIRSTGRSRGERRSIVATFRRSSFLDFIYFTDFETADPQTYATQRERDAANTACVKPRAQRAGNGCNEITFPDFDAIKGPFHTNDDILVCGSPDFGRTTRDRVEISGPATNGYTAGNSCSASPEFKGTKIHPAGRLALPTSNAALETVAQTGGYIFEGQTTIRLDSATSMTVTLSHPAGTLAAGTHSIALPSNGVVYVRNKGCTGTETPLTQRYADSVGCAVLTVSGRYSKSLTLASQADILIDGNIERDGDVVLGLIANNFVRVKHQVNSNCQNVAAGTMQDLKIQAAILTLEHSFIVDNYSCGSRLGTLTIDGAIAQKFRGPVGTFNAATNVGATGYTKDYMYDDRLKYRSPPFFLDPVSAAWRVIRTNEQVPAATD